MTFKRARVRKGERGNMAVYANTITKTEEQVDGGEEERHVPFLKWGLASCGAIIFTSCPNEVSSRAQR